MAVTGSRLRVPHIFHSNLSSSSLAGLERAAKSVTSFKSQSSGLSLDKPLPPLPSATPLSFRSTPVTLEQKRTSSIYSRSVSSWETPDSWGYIGTDADGAQLEVFLQPVAYMENNLQANGLQETQQPSTFEETPLSRPLVLPNPSPEPNDISTGNESSWHPFILDLPPSPALPLSSAEDTGFSIEAVGQTEALKRDSDALSQTDQIPIAYPADDRSEQPIAPIGRPPVSPAVYLSHLSEDKAFRALGLVTPDEAPVHHRGRTRNRQAPPRTCNYENYNPSRKKAKAAGNARIDRLLRSGYADDDETLKRLERLVVTDDYHDLLVDQYRGVRREPSVLTERSGRNYEGVHPADDPSLVPVPLFWREGSVERNNEGPKAASEKDAHLSEANGFAGKFRRSFPGKKKTQLLPTRLSTTTSSKSRMPPKHLRSAPMLKVQNSKHHPKGWASHIRRPSLDSKRLSAFHRRSKASAAARFRSKGNADKGKATTAPPLPLHLPTSLDRPVPQNVPPAAASPTSTGDGSTSIPSPTDIISAYSSQRHSEAITHSLLLGAADHGRRASYQTLTPPSSSPSLASADADASLPGSQRGSGAKEARKPHTRHSSLGTLSSSTSRAFHGVEKALERAKISLLHPKGGKGPASPPLTPSARPPTEPVNALPPPVVPDGERETEPTSSRLGRGLGMLERARGRRERRKEERRRARLKRSIRLVGPTDPHAVGQSVALGAGGRGDGWL